MSERSEERKARREAASIVKAEARAAHRPSKVWVWLWYLPVLVVLASGVVMSTQRSMTANIVDKARTFQDVSAASNSLETLEERSYDLRINLDESFTLKGAGYETKGSYRKGDKLLIPFDITGIKDVTLSNVYLEFVPPANVNLLAGLSVGVRACPTQWIQTDSAFACKGRSEVRVGRVPMANSTFPVLKDGETLKLGQTAHVLVEVGLVKDTILPLKGYEVALTSRLLGSKILS